MNRLALVRYRNDGLSKRGYVIVRHVRQAGGLSVSTAAVCLLGLVEYRA